MIFAVAGSGKTTYLVNQLNEVDRFLIVTYTINNVRNLRISIIKRFGYLPSNIKLYSYYSFLYSFCYKPFYHQKLRDKGINYETKPSQYLKGNTREFYIDKFNRLYSARISKLLLVGNNCENVIRRISKYFDYLLIDEIQDFGGNDFNLLKRLATSNLNQIYVGDFFQHTYDTGRDGAINSTLHNLLSNYLNEFHDMGMKPDLATLSKSYRCSPTSCRFITEKLGIEIYSHRKDETKIIYINRKEDAKKIVDDNAIVKLFYQQHKNHACFSRNWGESKGEDNYYDVCVVLNKTTFKKYSENKLHELAPITRNKLYVALSRAKNNLYILSQDLISVM